MSFPLLTLIVLSALGIDPPLKDSAAEPKLSAEQRAVQFLSREVAAWKPRNKCFSCHNNGDAARALYTADRLSIPLKNNPLEETTAWLQQPDQWEHNKVEGPFSDKKLADLQFAYALSEAVGSNAVKNRTPLLRAAEKIAAYQEPDGSWKLDSDQIIGSPVTYGRTLGTVVARQILHRADRKRFSKEIERSERWLSSRRPDNVFDAAALVLFLADSKIPETDKLLARCLEIIRTGEDPQGGWGPFVNSVAEPFDTAMVLLALSKLPEKQETSQLIQLIQRGRRFLINSQLKDGSWQETTRPAKAVSYAQRLSTAGWATLALLATRPDQQSR